MTSAPLRALLAILVLGLGVGCAQLPVTPVTPPPGFIYSDVQAPLSVNYHATPANSPKVGQATSKYLCVPFFWLTFGWDNCDLETAAKNGGITKVDYADYHLTNVLGIYEEFTVIAHGQ